MELSQVKVIRLYVEPRRSVRQTRPITPDREHEPVEPGQRSGPYDWALLGPLGTSPVLRMTLRRLVHSIPVIIGVTFLTFSLMNLLPGGTALALAGPGATKEQIQKLAAELHLNQPFFTRYWHWLSGAATGNLGHSLANGQPVSQIIGARLPVTVELVFVAMGVSVLLAVPMALLAAARPNGVVDRVTTYISVGGIALPNFVLGLMLILIFAVHLKVLPAIGYASLSNGVWPNLRTIILPCAALGFPLFCAYLRVLRGDLIDQMRGQEYIVTARAKGAPHRRVLTIHALRNSFFSLLTLVGLNLGVLMGGTVLIEQIFGVPGVGQALVTAITMQDATTVEAIVLVLALAVVASSFLTDLAYALLDPRIRNDRTHT